VVVFPFAFHIAVQQPLKPLWSRLLLCDHEPSQPSTVLCFMSLLMSLLPTSGEFVSEFPSPRVILSFFPPPWPYRLGWPCQELKLPPASLSGSWGVIKWNNYGFMYSLHATTITRILVKYNGCFITISCISYIRKLCVFHLWCLE
jgi:hypothetical protein